MNSLDQVEACGQIRGGQVDVVHLTMRPPFEPGSYNQMIGKLVRKMREFRQVALSYWEGPLPRDEEARQHVILVNSKQLSWWQRASLRLPYRVRKRLCGFGGRDWLVYLWGMMPILAQLRPKIVICYDAYQLGASLRRSIHWPCRLILAQHGLSYYLDQGYNQQVYSLRSFDVVQLLTHASYHFDRNRMPAYEPLVKVVPNWIDTDTFKPVSEEEKRRLRAKWQLPEGKKVVLLLSRLVPKKGAHLILDSWLRILERVPDAYLWIVGGISDSWSMKGYDRYLRQLVQALGVGSTVRMEGPIAPGLTASCYQAADLYVFPTVFVEGLPNSLLEAMACGLPCVASEIETTRDLCVEGAVQGVLEPNVEDAFVEPIGRLLTNSTVAQRLGQLARSTAEHHYSYAAVAPLTKEFYRRQIALAEGREEGAPNIPVAMAT